MQISSLDLPENIINVLKRDGIEELNEPQIKAIKKGLLDGKNLVVASPTASGKTLIAELAIIKRFLAGEKSVYLVPLKALASEKYEDFTKKYKDLGMRVAISTGDYDSGDDWLGGYDLIILSNEKMDSILRHNAKWIPDIRLIVADEVHLINDASRGPTLEIVLTKLRQMTNSQILALSATIKNSDEIAKWLKAGLVYSEYRPIKLHKGIFYPEEDGCVIDFLKKQERLEKINADGEIILCKDTLEKKKQALVFVSTRRSAEATAEKISNHIGKMLNTEEKKKLHEMADEIESILSPPTKQCTRLARILSNGVAFHHAGLVAKQRKIIEDNFKGGLIKFIVSTPTLAFGINLPAYRVLIRDVKRYNGDYGSSYIPNFEIQQMCLPYDSKILMEDGTEKNIGDLVEKGGSKVLSLATNKFNLKPCKVKNKFKRKSKVFVRIRAGGRELIATLEHPVIILKERKPVWMKISEIRKNDRIGIVSKITISKKPPVFMKFLNDRTYIKVSNDLVRHLLKRSGTTYRNAAKTLRVPYKTLKAYCYNKSVPLPIMKSLAKFSKCDDEELLNLLAGRKFKSKYGNEITLPKVIDDNFAWFLGLFAAEGSIINYTGKCRWNGVKYRKLKISNTNEKIINKLERISEKFGIEPYRSVQKSGFGSSKIAFRMEISNQILADILINLGVKPGAKSHLIDAGKVFDFPDYLVAEYLAGVFDGDGNLDKNANSIRLSSRSKQFIIDCKNLLLRFGIQSNIYSESGSFVLAVYRKDDIGKFLVKIPALRFSSPKPHCTRNTRPVTKIGDIAFEAVTKVENIKTEQPVAVYNFSVEKNETYICNGFVVHNCGRAGRPKYDKEGEAIMIAKTSKEAEDMKNRYLLSELEAIYSKLSSDPVLRMHVLSLIASETASTKKQLESFFSQTFFAHQYGDIEDVMEKIEKVLEELTSYKFIKQGEDDKFISSEFKSAFNLTTDVKLKATRIGKRVAELYIDPLSAKFIIDNIDAKSDLGYLTILCQCIEMRPCLRVKSSEDIESSLINMNIKIPDVWDLEYEDFLAAFKTALMFRDWTGEIGEDKLLDKYNIAPGELYTKTLNAEWMVYAARELAVLLNKNNIANNLNKLRLRIKYGVRKELLELVALRGIGRARARLLWNNGIRKISTLKATENDKIEKILGSKLAKQIIDQIREDQYEKFQKLKLKNRRE